MYKERGSCYVNTKKGPVFTLVQKRGDCYVGAKNEAVVTFVQRTRRLLR